MSLEELIISIVNGLDVEHLDKRIINYTDFKNGCIIPRPSVEVKIELTEGKLLRIDVTDYFKGVVK